MRLPCLSNTGIKNDVTRSQGASTDFHEQAAKDILHSLIFSNL